MNCYLITKFNPINRVDGIYTIDEWTSFSDIGKEYQGKILTREDYLKTENAYLSVISYAIGQSNIKCRIAEYEALWKNNTNWYNGKMLSGSEALSFSRDCLRELCWGKLFGKHFFIHFGYDYYLYISSRLDCRLLENKVKDSGLFIEKKQSPYLNKIDWFRYYFT